MESDRKSLRCLKREGANRSYIHKTGQVQQASSPISQRFVFSAPHVQGCLKQIPRPAPKSLPLGSLLPAWSSSSGAATTHTWRNPAPSGRLSVSSCERRLGQTRVTLGT